MIDITNIVVSEAEDVTEPVSLVEAKAWLQVDHDDHDALLTSMIKGARMTLEKFLNMSLVEKEITLDAENINDDWRTMMFPYAKEVSTVVVSSIDSADVEDLLEDGDDYYLRGATLRLASGRHGISYTTVPGTISQDLKEAILMEVAERYRARGENSNEGSLGLSEGAKVKAAPHQVVWL